MSAEPVPVDRPCQNCGVPLLGEHCYACGQPVKGLVRHFGSIAGDFLDSVFDLDSRTLRTLVPLLLRPGYLSTEYFDGHRVRYVSPVRLFVFLCVLSFFVLQFVAEPEFQLDDGNGVFAAESVAEVERLRDESLKAIEGTRARVDDPSALRRLDRDADRLRADAAAQIAWLGMRDAALARGTVPPPKPAPAPVDATLEFGTEPWDPVSNPARFESMPDWFNSGLNTMLGRMNDNLRRFRNEPREFFDAFMQSLPATFFVLLPLFALLLKGIYAFSRRLYMEHLIVALHSHAFLCLAVLLLVALDLPRRWSGPGLVHDTLGVLITVLVCWMPVYLWLMQKRVYRQGVLMTSLKYLVVGTLYALLLSFGLILNLATNLVTL